MKRIKLRKNKHKKINIITLIAILLIVTTVLLFNYIGKHVTPVILNYAEKHAKKVAVLVISQAVSEEVLNNFNDQDLFIDNESGIQYDTGKIMKLLRNVAVNVRGYLKKMEKGELEEIGISNTEYFNVSDKKLKNGVIYEVPSGIIFNNGLLANIGPKIPVKLSFVGDIVIDLVKDIKEFGINNAVIEISVYIKVTEQVILPFSSNQIEVETTIPLTIKVFKGDVPGYYLGTPYTLGAE